MTDLKIFPDVRHISNSEVSAFLACERKWFYAHSRNIAPKVYSTSLSRGIIGHEILAAYYGVLIGVDANSRANREKAEGVADQVWMRFYAQASENGYDMEMLYDLKRILDRYYLWAPTQEIGWKFLHVETKYAVPLTDEYDYVMRLDLLAQDPTGEKLVVDHKFVYDFWTATGLDMNPQAPKYVAALKVNGVPIERAMVNMLRWRTKKGEMLDSDMFRRDRLKPMSAEIRNVMREQILASRRIIELRKMPLEVQAEKVLRNLSPYTCRSCSFADPCKAELQGGDITVMLDTYFTENTYDYNKGDDDSIL